MKKKSRPKVKTVSHHVRRYFFSVLAVSILFATIYPFLSTKPKIVCANTISCSKSLTLKVENNAIGVFNNQKIIPPKITLSINDTRPNVFGAATGSGDKHIYVDLTKQMLYAYQSNDLFLETPVSTGKWHDTPTGDFTIWEKIRATRMSGGSGADYYDLPNVPFVMFFYNSDVPAGAGFSLHGTYWHDNFGHAMSHGCINMRIVDAEKLYNWANPSTMGYSTIASQNNQGTKITVYGTAL